MSQSEGDMSLQADLAVSEDLHPTYRSERRALLLALMLIAPVLAHAQSCLTGRVVDARNLQPVEGAAISADWAENGTQRLHFSRETTSDSTGHYRLCLSRRSAVLVQAIVGTSVAYLPITTPNADTAVSDLRVPMEADTTGAIVAGHVLAEDGTPVEGATVTILGGREQAPTNADGAYGLRGPEGSQVLLVRRIGLDAAVVPIELGAKLPRLVNVRMQRLPPTLDVVTVVADRLRLGPVYDAIGLTQRVRDGHGHILKLDDIERKQASEAIQLAEGIPGVRYRADHNGRLHLYPARDAGLATIASYGDCTAYIIDGNLLGNGNAVYTVDKMDIPLVNEDEAALPKPGDLIAMEVYQPGEPSPLEIPAVNRCLKVFFWTKAMLGKP
jgi:hypothetical protein